MEVLEFIKKENEYVAEFKATSDFNLHIERSIGGRLSVRQKTVENGEYSEAFSTGRVAEAKIFDYDFTAVVYPKWIQISSVSPVEYGVVTFTL